MKRLITLSDRRRISQAQRVFKNQLKRVSARPRRVMVGWRGGAEETSVYWSPKLNIWSAFARGERSYWNAFGIKEPRGRSASSIIVEVNPPYSGIYRLTQGAIAEDIQGNLFVIHRGKIGGGRPGIGKSLFEENFQGKWALLNDGDRINEVALIGRLESNRFPNLLKSFVYEVSRIKSLAGNH